VLELTREDVAAAVTETVSVPTIGIGAMEHCDGQVLVLHDLLGFTSRISPSFVKQYAQVGQVIREATEQYARELGLDSHRLGFRQTKPLRVRFSTILSIKRRESAQQFFAPSFMAP